MKNAYFLFAFVLLIFTSCIPDDGPPIFVTEENHLQYFGFAMIDADWDDPLDDPSTKTNYTDEVNGFTNLADILVTSTDPGYSVRITEMLQNQLTPLLRIKDIFFEPDGINAPSGTSFSLRQDYKERWNAFVSANYIFFHSHRVVFYLGEEPTWNGISFNHLKAAADYIKETVIDGPIVIVESHLSLEELQIPESIDWIGFRHYHVKNPNTDIDFQNELSTLKEKLPLGYQRILLVMDTHHNELEHGLNAGITIEDMTEIATNYYELAKSEPKTIAILGDFWPGGLEDENALGAREMLQETLNEYERIGKEITNK